MDPVRWGVLGTSKYAREWIVPGLMKSSDLAVIAVGSREKSKAEAFANDLKISKSYGSYEELLADPDVEVVYNPLPNHLHVPLTLQAARAGKHVLCEKPIALSAREASMLREIPEDILVAEAFMVRHHPQWEEARSLARTGVLGRIHTLQSFFSFYLIDPTDIRHRTDWGGGALLDIGCYPVVAGRFIFEREPSRAIALIDRDPQFGTDRLVTGIVDFGEGRRIEFTVSTQAVAHQRLEIIGTSGRLELPIPFNPPLGEASVIRLDRSDAIGVSAASEKEIPPANQYQREGEAFSRAVRGMEPLEYGIEDAIANMRVIDALFRSANSGKWENVQP
jgi:predicted dehydrogenase